MRFYIVNKDTEKCHHYKEQLHNLLINKNFVYDEFCPEIVFSIGGDGTFLKSVHKFIDCDPLFIGINEGHLGFLCQFSIEDVSDIIYKLLSNNYNEVDYPILKLQIGDGDILYGFNEVRIESINGTSLQMDVYVNDDFLEKIKCDGLVFATSIGSTALSRGLGGALIDPKMNVIEMVEKTPINNSYYSSLNSPVIFSYNTVIRIENFSHGDFNIYNDNNSYEIRGFEDEVITINYSRKFIKTLQNDDISYVNRLNDAFIK